ncbi:MAG: hypothetical protein M3N98_03925 [Actinomycetota bacterium]|nr:hypothetical protein [Actinomycetota bacterium]
MPRFSAWLRDNAERHLMIAAEETIADRYGARMPNRPPGLRGWFFLSVFVPVYQRLPWKVRSAAIAAMPGSHRQGWESRDRHTRPPAV